MGFFVRKVSPLFFDPQRIAVIIISRVGGDASAWYLDENTSRTEPRSQSRHESCNVQQQIHHVGSTAWDNYGYVRVVIKSGRRRRPTRTPRWERMPRRHRNASDTEDAERKWHLALIERETRDDNTRSSRGTLPLPSSLISRRRLLTEGVIETEWFIWEMMARMQSDEGIASR